MLLYDSKLYVLLTRIRDLSDLPNKFFKTYGYHVRKDFVYERHPFLLRIVLGLALDNVDISILLALPDGTSNDLFGMLSCHETNPPIEYILL